MFKSDKLRNSNSREKFINKNYTSLRLSYFMINRQIDYYSCLINETNLYHLSDHNFFILSIRP